MDDIEDVFHDIMIKFLQNPLAVKAQPINSFSIAMMCCAPEYILESKYNKSKVPLITMDEEGEETRLKLKTHII